MSAPAVPDAPEGTPWLGDRTRLVLLAVGALLLIAATVFGVRVLTVPPLHPVPVATASQA
jgi:hypothetical protein